MAQLRSEMGMQAAEQFTIAGEINRCRWHSGVQLGYLVVAKHPVVAAQALDECSVGRRGQPDDLVALFALASVAMQQVGHAYRGLAGRAGQHQAFGIEEAIVGEEVVEQERGGEQRAQQHLQGFIVGTVERVAEQRRYWL